MEKEKELEKEELNLFEHGYSEFEHSEWSCYCFGSKPGNGFLWVPQKGKVPNFFWRWMQHLILGNKWVKNA